ncbi:MAG: RHS repeat-associated core domain-containing protein [Pirellulales bacterium]
MYITLDAAGRVSRKQDQKGDTCTFNYDLAGRLTSRDYRTAANSPSGTIADNDQFSYDKAGRMLTAYSGRYSNTVGYAYDSAGRNKTESLTIAGQTYTTKADYNARGELTKYTNPDSTVVDRTYTAGGELYQLKHAGTTIDTRAYDNGGRMSSSTLNNGVVDTRAYGTDNTLSSITFTGSGTSIGNLSYAWDNNHNKTSETITGTMSNYGFSIPTGGYDSEDRLVSFNRTSGLSQSWSLSAVGDWNSVTTNGTAQTRTHGPTHELLTGAGSNVNTDVKGNITLIPSSLRPNASSLTSTWDFDNRLTSATTGSTTVSHQYDALGRRVARTSGSSTTVYVQAGQQTIADYASGAAPASSTYRYVYASYIDEPVMRWTTSSSTAVYYHRNQQYSVTALSDSSGAVLERYAYTAYGAPTIANASGTVLSSSAQNNRYTYTGREWDNDIQQYHYRARMYDPALGRFCSRDPVGYEGSSYYVSEDFLSNYSADALLEDSTDISIPLGFPFEWLPELPQPCGSMSFTATADVSVVPKSLLIKAAVVARLRLNKTFPISLSASVPCSNGKTCCPKQTVDMNLKLKLSFRPKQTPKHKVTIDIDLSLSRTVGVCIMDPCPCPEPDPTVTWVFSYQFSLDNFKK